MIRRMVTWVGYLEKSMCTSLSEFFISSPPLSPLILQSRQAFPTSLLEGFLPEELSALLVFFKAENHKRMMLDFLE